MPVAPRGDHRIVPENTSIEVQTTTAQIELSLDELQDPDYHGWQTQAVWNAHPHAAAERSLCQPKDTVETTASHDVGDWDCLVRSAPGRFAWLRLVLRGDGSATPGVHGIVVEYPRVSLRRYLPAVFGAEPVSADFTDRFLGISIPRCVQSNGNSTPKSRLFDPLSTPATRSGVDGIDFLTWLATWIGIALDRHWPEERRRRFLKSAPVFFGQRGTRKGLWGALLAYLGMEGPACCAKPERLQRCVPRPLNCQPEPSASCDWERPPLILEHYKLRRWLWVGKGRLGDDSMIWGRSIVNRSQLGANAQVGVTQLKTVPDPARDPFLEYAHRYTVFVPARVRSSPEERKGLENLLQAESPAHTLYDVRYVEPRFRVGVQAMLGYDSVIARIPQGVRLGDAELGQGTVLTGAPRTRKGPSMVVGANARIGTSTKLT